MDFELFDDINFLSVSDGCDTGQDIFTEWSILETAKLSAEGEEIYNYWYSLLSRMMKHWSAVIEMNLNEAIFFCLEAANICSGLYSIQNSPYYININPQHSCFWYKDHSPIRAMRIYRVTIALFESINYWCYYESPMPITLNKSGLAIFLQTPIQIEWEKYDSFLGYWKQQQAKS